MAKGKRGFGSLRKLPSGRWQARYMGPDGNRHQAPRTFGAKIDGEGWLGQERRKIDLGVWEPPTKKEAEEKPDEPTFGEYAKRWVEERRTKGKPLTDMTKETYGALLDLHILPTFENEPLSAITKESVRAWHAVLLPDSPTRRMNAYALFRTIMGTAEEEDLVEVNPVKIRGAGSTVEKEHEVVPATTEELDIMIEAMPESLRAMIVLGTWTSLRFGECAELRRKDLVVDESAKKPKVGVKVRRSVVRPTGKGPVVKEPKTRAGNRTIALPQHVVPLVLAHLRDHVGAEPDSLLFPARDGRQITRNTFTRHYYRAREAAGRPDLWFHDLRHTGATSAAQAGATLAELLHRVGHSDVEVAMKYQHVARNRDQELADEMSRRATKGRKKKRAESEPQADEDDGPTSPEPNDSPARRRGRKATDQAGE